MSTHWHSRASLEEEPVTFETFKKYFDRDAVERDPQDFFQSSTSAAGSSKGNTKTRFTAHQRVVLLENFHKSLDMSKAEIRSLYDTLGESLGLPARIVRIWFQNARSGRKAGKPMYC